jgi:probable phosphoglycerate mutase
MTEVTTLYLIRHGQTDANAGGRIQGQSESALSDLGRAQAARVAEAVAALGPRALYTSDLSRARDTASPIAARTGLDLDLEPGLRERAYGVLEGLSWLEVQARHPEIYAALASADPEFRIPGGESRRDLSVRVAAALDALAARHVGEAFAAVSHGGVMSAFTAHVLGVPLGRPPALRTLNGCISTFERVDGVWRMLTFGAVAHLGGGAAPRPPPGALSSA